MTLGLVSAVMRSIYCGIPGPGVTRVVSHAPQAMDSVCHARINTMPGIFITFIYTDLPGLVRWGLDLRY